VPTNAEVNAWFAALEHPLRPVMQLVRRALLANPAIEEKVQYGTVTFHYVSDLCSFVQVKDKKQVSLMFNAAGRLSGDFPGLTGKSVKYMRFHSEQEVDERYEELQRITAAWWAYKATGS
jgi:Domain of unknown function (DU1801)